MSDDTHTKIELMAQDITYIKAELAEIKSLIKEVASSKADKWTEDVLKWVIGVVGVAVLGSLMGLIFIK